MRLSFLQEMLVIAASCLAVVLIAELCLVMTPQVMRSATVFDESLHESQAAPSTDEQPPRFVMPTRDSMRAFIERPLFEKSRRSREAIYEPEKETGSVGEVVLVATVVTSSESVAVLQFENRLKPVRARVGDVVEGWRVLQIGQKGVLLSNNLSEQWISTGAQN